MGTGVSKPVVERAAEFVKSGKTLPYAMSGEDIYFHPINLVDSLEQEGESLTYCPDDLNERRELPELPIEIWQRVFVHLRRKVGPIKEKTRKRGDYHQRDLVNAMRVCRKFYYLAAPVLYARVVTDKPHLFLYGAAEESLASIQRYKRWTKLDLLQFVHRLDLIYTSFPTCKIDLRFPISERDKKKFEAKIFRYEKDSEEIRRMIQDLDNSQSAVRYIHYFRGLRRTYMKSNTPVIMANLQILTTSHPSFKYEYEHEAPFLDRPFYGISNPNNNVNWPRYTLLPSKLDRYTHKIDGRENSFSAMSTINKRLQFSYELARLATPKHVCMDDSAGPYAYTRYEGRYDKIKLPQPETITLHIYPRSVEKFILPTRPDAKVFFRWRVQPYIYQGSTSRWVLDTHEWIVYSDRRQKADFFLWLRHNLGEFKKYQELDEKTKALTTVAKSFKPEHKTRIEVYGVLGNIELIDHGMETLAEEGWFSFDVWWTYELKVSQLCAFLDIIPGIGDIILVDEEAGPCPACRVSTDGIRYD
ncbi:uncharacterized protein I303_103914 [Kwoniella dejecticola CBS 10117]|uniref:Uncharacterized protein n=1 Tax=Kwoniella dejecticola CBS 10117 TaxID=1296121 RepID=A0A1A6A828_9TREE|nr:uncharacterized protein I303_03932 [Kwoniella dejecticola CBS 10117]OBR86212.1 hypothetical protein I303_03932 [Kwoniella dejecticola CBS 10117]